jgi:hypothetical protein
MKVLATLTLILQLTFVSQSYAATSYDDSTCDNVCNQIVDQSTDKEISIKGPDGWSTSDDAWCAANPFSASAPAASSTVAAQDNRCQYHDSQVLTYCIAYDKTQQATGMEMPLMILDVGGAAICGTVCAGGLSTETMYMACRIDSTAASAMELYDALVLDSDTVSRSITGVLGAAGLVGNYLEYQEAGGLKQFLNGSHDVNQNSKRNACIIAGVMAAAAGMRAWDMTHQQLSKKSACNSIKNLLSNSPVVGAAASTATGSASSGSSTGSLGTATGGGSLGTTSDIAAQVACAQKSLSSCSFAQQGQMAAATDGGLLDSSGLGLAAAQQMANSGLAGPSPSSPDAGAMLGSALGDLGDVGAKLVDVAKAAQLHGDELRHSSAYSGGGEAAAAAPGALGGFSFDAPGAAAKGDMKFDRVPATTGDGDIWHAGYKGSIFQIVSTKIVQSKARIDSLDWSTPLNRALVGLPRERK